MFEGEYKNNNLLPALKWGMWIIFFSSTSLSVSQMTKYVRVLAQQLHIIIFIPFSSRLLEKSENLFWRKSYIDLEEIVSSVEEEGFGSGQLIETEDEIEDTVGYINVLFKRVARFFEKQCIMTFLSHFFFYTFVACS